jgi:hypothetical protein
MKTIVRARAVLLPYTKPHLFQVLTPPNVTSLRTKLPIHEALGITLKPYPNHRRLNTGYMEWAHYTITEHMYMVLRLAGGTSYPLPAKCCFRDIAGKNS